MTSQAEAPLSFTGENKGPYAAIDIGTNTIRMLIAQIDSRGHVQPLDALQQDVHLGHDTFTKGYIENEKIETCIQTLKNFLKILQQYQITQDDRIRAVATSSVREAANRNDFLDRIYIATGINIHIAEEAEVNRYTYMAVYPLLAADRSFAKAETFIIETGAGSTQVLLSQKEAVLFSQSFRFGAFRLREMIDMQEYSPPRFRKFVETQIQRILEQIEQKAHIRRKPNIMVLGGDVRFAAAQIHSDWNKSDLLKLSVKDLAAFTDTVLETSVDELVRKHHLSYPEAETLGPALLTYIKLAQKLKVEILLVCALSMRDGVMLAMSQPRFWMDKFRGQVINAAFDLLERFSMDTAHGVHVKQLSVELFHQLQNIHQLTPWHETLLSVAALLHDIGDYISFRRHHKHSRYLILNCEIFGLSSHDLVLTALTARYHRKATPRPYHEDYGTLDMFDRIAVTQMAAILRVADALDRSHAQRIRKIQVVITDGSVVITAPQVTDLTMEQFALKTKGAMFENVFGLRVVLREG